MALPQKLTLDMLQTTWAKQLNPLLANPTLDTVLLKNISLAAGTNVINHRLGRILQGWNPTRMRSPATLYDTQDTNQTPQLTLTLISSADVVIDLVVF